MEGFAACFADLDDPRTGNAVRHTMLEMPVIALCSVLTGGENRADMATSAATRKLRRAALRGAFPTEVLAQV